MQETLRHLKQLATESAIYGFAGILSRFLGFLTIPIYTRIFPPKDYGVMGLITNLMTLLTIFVVLGLDNAAYRWYWDTEDREDRKAILATWSWCQFSVALLLSLPIFAFSKSLGHTLLQREDGWIYFCLSAATLPLSTLTMIVVNWFRMQRRPWVMLFFSTGTFFLNILLIIILVVALHLKLAGVYTAQLITVFFGTIVAVTLMRDWIHPEKFSWLRLKEMFSYGAPMIPAAIAYWVVNLSGCYFIRFFSTIDEVGLFQVGSMIAAIVAFITEAFQQAWGPFAMSIHKQHNARQVYANTLLAYLCVSCFASMALFLFAPEIVNIFCTEAYSNTQWVIGILAFNYVLIGLGYIAALGANIAKTTKPVGIAMIISAILAFELNFLLVPILGKEGAAISALLSQLIVPVYVFYHSQKLYPIPYRFGVAVVIFLSALILSISGALFSPKALFLSISVKILFMLLFVSILFLFNIRKFSLD